MTWGDINNSNAQRISWRRFYRTPAFCFATHKPVAWKLCFAQGLNTGSPKYMVLCRENRRKNKRRMLLSLTRKTCQTFGLDATDGLVTVCLLQAHSRVFACHARVERSNLSPSSTFPRPGIPTYKEKTIVLTRRPRYDTATWEQAARFILYAQSSRELTFPSPHSPSFNQQPGTINPSYTRAKQQTNLPMVI